MFVRDGVGFTRFILAENDPLKPIDAALVAVVHALEQCQAPSMIIGGVAAGLLSDPRTTRDVDAAIWVDDDDVLDQFLNLLADYKIVPRIKNALEFARHSRVLLLIYKPTGTKVDIALSLLPFEEQAFRNRRSVPYKGMTVSLPRPEDLIVMKAVANRETDHGDIAKLLRHHEHLDVAHIRRWARQHAVALESPDIMTNLDRLIKQSGRKIPTSRPSRKKRR